MLWDPSLLLSFVDNSFAGFVPSCSSFSAIAIKDIKKRWIYLLTANIVFQLWSLFSHREFLYWVKCLLFLPDKETQQYLFN